MAIILAGNLNFQSFFSNVQRISFVSDPAVCGWSWAGSQAGRRTLGWALGRPPCCLWRLTPTLSSRCKTSALQCQTHPGGKKRHHSVSNPPLLRCWVTKLCTRHIGKRCLPDLLEQTKFYTLHCIKRAGNICCYLKEAFHLSAKFYNLWWESHERGCNLD